MRAGLLALVDECDRNLAKPLGRRRIVLEQLAEANRAGEPAGPPPTISTPTSIRSSGASVGAAITSSLENGGG